MNPHRADINMDTPQLILLSIEIVNLASAHLAGSLWVVQYARSTSNSQSIDVVIRSDI